MLSPETYGVCSVTASPLRAEASHRSEMVSQLLFGEIAELLEKKEEDWLRVRGLYDGYEGWCTSSHLAPVDPNKLLGQTLWMTPHWSTPAILHKKTIHLPLGSQLFSDIPDRYLLGNHRIGIREKLWDPANRKPNPAALRKIAFQFLNTPYLWGGKSVFGTDCSGFTQTVFRFFGIHLLRDAWQQETQGSPVASLTGSRFGDLAFFDNAQGRITHVGLILDDHQIIHASGKVRIDRLTRSGIQHEELGKQTHRLKSIRRFF